MLNGSRLPVLLALLPGGAFAQGFNLDTGTASTAPPVNYAGAARQQGFWNNHIGNDASPFPLLDLQGRTSSATFSMNLPFGPALYSNGVLRAGDALLLEDYFDLHSTRGEFTFSGLAEGHYSVFTYAWAADSPVVRMSIDVNGVGVQLIGGGWPGSPTLGVNYAQHEVDLKTAEALAIFVRGVPTNGTLNGIQLVYHAGFADAGEPDAAGADDADVADALEADATAPDSTVLVDGGPALDAAQRFDATPSDATAARDDAGAATSPDARPAGDATSAPAAEAGSGCGCRAAGGSPVEVWLLAVLFLAVRQRSRAISAAL